MSAVRRVQVLVIIAGVVGALSLLTWMAASGAGAQTPSPPSPPGTPELFNLEHVFNFNPGDHDPDRSPSVGSDLEFFTHTVPLRDYDTGRFVDEDGKPVTGQGRGVEQGKGVNPVMGEREFAVMGSYQRGGYVFDITDPEHPQFVTQVTCRQDRNDVGIKKFTDAETGATRVVLALTQQSGEPCGDGEGDGGVGVQVNSPPDLAGFSDATQWSGTAAVDGQTADFAYAGTGCTAASYAGVDVDGKIALIDKFASATSPDTCPTFTFKQKMDAAEAAGAIGVVQVDDDDEPSAGSALDSGIPGMEIVNSDGAPIRDAVVEGEEPVNATLTQAETDVPVIGEGSGGIGVFDITDPYDWKPMYRLHTGDGGVHNFIFHPEKPFGYVSNGALPGLVNEIPIVDFTDVDQPQVLTDRAPTEGGVHDIEFSPHGYRAYAASENNYRIYDTSDPANPVLLSRTPNVGSYAHGVFPSSDGNLMVTNNESLVIGGFFVEGTGVCPGEGLAAYDTSNEEAPVGPLGYYTPDVVGPTDERPCTSHFGRFAPGTKVLSMGWYIAGTRIVDWSDPSNPVEVAGAVLEDTDTWAAKFHKGPYVYAGDRKRGFDVFRWTGEGPAPWLVEEQETSASAAPDATPPDPSEEIPAEVSEALPSEDGQPSQVDDASSGVEAVTDGVGERLQASHVGSSPTPAAGVALVLVLLTASAVAHRLWSDARSSP